MNPHFVFLDRDGVINHDSPHYIRHPDAFQFIDGSIQAICRLNRAGYAPIVITNQSIIGRGWVDASVLGDIHRKMRSGVASAGGDIHDIFHCPHHPRDGCDCRKPEPGLIFQAKQKYGIHLAETAVIGDSAKDILCAGNAGCGLAILVKTGNFRKAQSLLNEAAVAPDHIADDLLGAVDWLLSTEAA